MNITIEGRDNRRSLTGDQIPGGHGSSIVSQQSELSSFLDDPEWLRIPGAIRRFGVGRSTLYSLIRDGKVKTASIRKRGNQSGIRLISTDSLRAYVEQFVEENEK